MAELSQLLAKEEELVHKGKTYKLAPLTFEVQAAYEQWLEGRAWEALRRQRIHMNASEYQQQSEILQQSIAGDKYGWFSEACWNSLGGLYGVEGMNLSKGSRQLMLIRLRAGQVENGVPLDEALVQEIVETHLEDIRTLMQKMDFDPNSPRPASPGDPGNSSPSSPTSPTSST